MTEKEAIEALKEHKQLLDKKYLKSRWGTAIGTVLQALEQKDKEIQELKEKYDKDTHTLQNHLDVANADKLVKDKIIDEMAKYIGDEDVSETFCGDKISCDEDCQECVKQYFERKVREENE